MLSRARSGRAPITVDDLGEAARGHPGTLSAVIRRPSRAVQVSVSRKALLVSAGVVAAGAVALTGCQTQSPIQTQFTYQPADGVAVNLGTVKVRDLVIVSSAKDQPGALSGVVVNDGDQPVRISFATADGAQTSTQAPAHESLKLGDGATADTTTLPKVATTPGGLVQLEVSTPEGGAQRVQVPVLLPQGYYSTVTPSGGATSTSTSSEPSPKSTPTATASVSAEASSTP